LTEANLCKYITVKLTKEELLEHSNNLGLKMNSRSTNSSICYSLLGAILSAPKYTIMNKLGKEYFNPDKKGLPKKLSNMTHKEIANKIIGDIKMLSGPISSHILVPKKDFIRELGRSPPVFMLLGDIHVGRNGCNPCNTEDGCYSLYYDNPTFLKYLSNLSKESDVSIDLFLEGWRDKDGYYDHNNIFISTNSHHNSALSNSTYLTFPCVGQRTEKSLPSSCFFNEFRTHYTNQRHVDFINHYINEKYVADAIFTSFYEHFNMSQQYSTSKISALLMSYLLALNRKFPDFTPIEILEEVKKVCEATNSRDTIDIFFNSRFFKTYSRTLHEFYKLPEFIQTQFLTRLSYNKECVITRDIEMRVKITSVLSDFISLLNNKGNISIIDALDSKKEEILKIFDDIYNEVGLALGARLVDIYTISRALKTFKDGLPSQLSVVYQGDNHIKNQLKLLAGFYNVISTKQLSVRVDTANTINSIRKKMVKCIDLELSKKFLTREKILSLNTAPKIRFMFELFNYGYNITNVEDITAELNYVSPISFPQIIISVAKSSGLPFPNLSTVEMRTLIFNKLVLVNQFIALDYPRVSVEDYLQLLDIIDVINNPDKNEEIEDLTTIRYLKDKKIKREYTFRVYLQPVD
jgi:hypothetical protein